MDFWPRADLTKKGGDIDIYIETGAKTAKEAINMKSFFLWDLEQQSDLSSLQSGGYMRRPTWCF